MATVTADEPAAGGDTRRGLSLVYKLSLAICLVLAFAIGLSALLNYFNFQKTYNDLVRSSYTVMLRDIGYSIQYGLGLGLSLASMENIPDLLETARATAPNIRSIQVIAPDGEVLFHTEPERVGTMVDHELRNVAFRFAEGDEVWSQVAEQDYLIGLGLDNSFDRTEGALILAFSRAETASVYRRILHQLLQQSVLVVLTFSVVSVLCVFLVLRRLTNSLRRIERSLWQSTQGEPPVLTQANAVSTLEREFAAFEETLQQAREELEPSPSVARPTPEHTAPR